MLDPKFTKPVSSIISTETETKTHKSIPVEEILYTLCDRTVSNDKKANYFVSFGLPAEIGHLDLASSMSLAYPELQQLNVDQIIITPIPARYYSELIDGRSITFKVPTTGGAGANLSAVTLYSSTYSSDKPVRSESNILLGDNIVFLFSDDINRPYSGFTVNEIGNRVSESGTTTWEPSSTNYLKRPSAVSYSEVKGTNTANGFSSDTRTVINYSVTVPGEYPENRPGYNYDIPVGFAVLDKGFIVLTHTGITQNFPWSSGYTSGSNIPVNASVMSAKTNAYFTGQTAGEDASALKFVDINTEFKTIVACLAMPKEFYISNNPTWNRDEALESINNQQGFINIDPVYITEIGLYNALGELVAIAKTSEPVEKDYTNVVTFDITIDM